MAAVDTAAAVVVHLEEAADIVAVARCVLVGTAVVARCTAEPRLDDNSVESHSDVELDNVPGNSKMFNFNFIAQHGATHVCIWRVVAVRHVGMWWQSTFGDQSVDFFLPTSLEFQVFVVRVLRLLIDLKQKIASSIALFDS